MQAMSQGLRVLHSQPRFGQTLGSDGQMKLGGRQDVLLYIHRANDAGVLCIYGRWRIRSYPLRN
jgi:hypothetical protein